jgi:hypothetical protein
MVDTKPLRGIVGFVIPPDSANVRLKLAALTFIAAYSGALAVPASATSAPQLAQLARALVPTAARASLSPKDLAVRDCGISPTYPCISAFFSLRGSPEVRTRVLRRQALAAGWHIVRSGRDGTNTSLELVRGVYHARYLIPPAGDRFPITGLELYGPANVLARPTPAERARWSSAKRRYVAAADAVCSRTIGRMKKTRDVQPAVKKAARGLHALPPPAGETKRVESFLRPLDTLVRALQALAAAKGEDALGPAVALGEYVKRFERAAARYGLTRCTFH